MNLEICKKCLSSDNLSVLLYCPRRRNKTEPKAPLTLAVLCISKGLGYHHQCNLRFPFRGNYAIDSRFLGKWVGNRIYEDIFQLKKEEYEAFFNLLKSSCVYRIAGKDTNKCFYSLEHDVCDWSIEK